MGFNDSLHKRAYVYVKCKGLYTTYPDDYSNRIVTSTNPNTYPQEGYSGGYYFHSVTSDQMSEWRSRSNWNESWVSSNLNPNFKVEHFDDRKWLIFM